MRIRMLLDRICNGRKNTELKEIRVKGKDESGEGGYLLN
jgi:hypothetical protein